MTRDEKNLFVDQRVRVIAKQFSAPCDGDLLPLLFRTIGYVHGAALDASRGDSCWLGGALWRVDASIDAPMSV